MASYQSKILSAAINTDGVPAEDAPLPGMVKNTDRLADKTIHHLMSNSYAFGGNNISVVLGSNMAFENGH